MSCEHSTPPDSHRNRSGGSQQVPRGECGQFERDADTLARLAEFIEDQEPIRDRWYIIPSVTGGERNASERSFGLDPAESSSIIQILASFDSPLPAPRSACPLTLEEALDTRVPGQGRVRGAEVDTGADEILIRSFAAK